MTLFNEIIGVYEPIAHLYNFLSHLSKFPLTRSSSCKFLLTTDLTTKTQIVMQENIFNEFMFILTHVASIIFVGHWSQSYVIELCESSDPSKRV